MGQPSASVDGRRYVRWTFSLEMRGRLAEHGAASLVSFAALGDHVLMSTAPRARLRRDPGVGEDWTESWDPPRTTSGSSSEVARQRRVTSMIPPMNRRRAGSPQGPGPLVLAPYNRQLNDKTSN